MLEPSMNVEHSHCFYKKISWRPVIVGALVGVGISFLLNIFSLAIGLTAFSTNKEGVTAFAVGGFLGLLIGSIVAMFVAGWVAGYLARWHRNKNWGVVYGFLAWTLALLILIAFSAPFSAFISSYSGSITDQKIVLLKTVDTPKTEVVATPTQTTVTKDEVADAAKVAFAIFALFFLAALAACLGGYAGMACRCDDEVDVNVNEEHVVDRPRV